MSQIRIETVSHKAPRPRILGSAIRTLTLGLATVADVLIAYYFTRPAVTLLAGSKLFSEGRFIGMRAALGVTSS